VTRYGHVDNQKAAGFPVTVACAAAGVSTSGYYDWAAREAAGPTARQLAEAELVALMRDIFDAADGNYGVPRMYKALRKAGLVVNVKRVARLMRLHGMAGRFRRRSIRTTFPGPDGYVIPDLIGRRFSPGAPDVAWCQDITYVPTGEGWLYLASTLDLGSRRLLGYSMADHMRSELVLDALAMAVAARGGDHAVAGVIAHADRGSQGGFKWPSQHLDRGGVDGTRVRMVGQGRSPIGAEEEPTEGRPHISGSDSVAGCADDRLAGGPGSVLGGDSSGCENRGGGGGGGGVIPRRVQVVPSRWRREPLSSPDSVGPIPVVRRARGHRDLARPEGDGPRDRPTAEAKPLHDFSRVASKRILTGISADL
jgi:hypothetical protein